MSMSGYFDERSRLNSTEATHEECKTIQPLPDLDKLTAWSILGILLLLVVLMVCLNVFLIVNINKRRIHKPMTRFFLTSLACTDLGVALIIMPFNGINFTFGTIDIFSDVICDVINSLDVMLSSASIFHLAVLTFERYVGLCFPFSYSKWCNTKTMGITYLLSWIICISVSFGLIMPGFNYYGIDQTVLDCFQHFMGTTAKCTFICGQMYMLVSSIITILIPMIAVVYLNIRVFRHIRQSCNNKIMTSLCKYTQNHEAQCVHASKTLVMLTGCFLLCWLPFFIANAVIVMADYTIPYTVFTALTWLGYLNSAANPALFLITQSRTCVGRIKVKARSRYLYNIKMSSV